MDTATSKDLRKCPLCKSTQIYQEVSVIAKQMVNTGKIIHVNKNNIDNVFDPYYCNKCGWSEL